MNKTHSLNAVSDIKAEVQKENESLYWKNWTIATAWCVLFFEGNCWKGLRVQILTKITSHKILKTRLKTIIKLIIGAKISVYDIKFLPEVFWDINFISHSLFSKVESSLFKVFFLIFFLFNKERRFV